MSLNIHHVSSRDTTIIGQVRPAWNVDNGRSIWKNVEGLKCWRGRTRGTMCKRARTTMSALENQGKGRDDNEEGEGEQGSPDNDQGEHAHDWMCPESDMASQEQDAFTSYQSPARSTSTSPEFPDMIDLPPATSEEDPAWKAFFEGAKDDTTLARSGNGAASTSRNSGMIDDDGWDVQDTASRTSESIDHWKPWTTDDVEEYNYLSALRRSSPQDYSMYREQLRGRSHVSSRSLTSRWGKRKEWEWDTRDDDGWAAKRVKYVRHHTDHFPPPAPGPAPAPAKSSRPAPSVPRSKSQFFRFRSANDGYRGQRKSVSSITIRSHSCPSLHQSTRSKSQSIVLKLTTRPRDWFDRMIDQAEPRYQKPRKRSHRTSSGPKRAKRFKARDLNKESL